MGDNPSRNIVRLRFMCFSTAKTPFSNPNPHKQLSPDTHRQPGSPNAVVPCLQAPLCFTLNSCIVATISDLRDDVGSAHGDAAGRCLRTGAQAMGGHEGGGRGKGRSRRRDGSQEGKAEHRRSKKLGQSSERHPFRLYVLKKTFKRSFLGSSIKF